MTAPLDFLRAFARELDAAGIESALTSGMACVFYGLQQNTKDFDWIVRPEDLERFRGLLGELEGRLPPWRVSYRTIFGAPVLVEYLRHGWTSHLSIRDTADSPEHHVDLFGRPPRVRSVETGPEDPVFASRHVVAQMKRTDRPRDWPIVDGLGLQLRRESMELALLHIQDPVLLRKAWSESSGDDRQGAASRRPLLSLLAEVRDPDALDAWIRLERIVWETVNRERYQRYQAAWKEFYRSWRSAPDFEWPMGGGFAEQHDRVSRAARHHGLPEDPIGDRLALYEMALKKAVVRADSTAEKVSRVQPPLEEILP